MLSRISAFVTLLVAFLLFSASAKTTWSRNSAARSLTASHYFANGYSAEAATNFENALTPFLRARAAHIALAPTSYIPSETDYRTIAKYWSRFSRAFLALYAQATAIPAGRRTYDSPGGHIQIIYAVSGEDSVDVTDTIGYSTNNWRVRQPGPNGVPDYVEYVAYAADSAWSMEVNRFGFVQPYPYIGNGYASSRFKIYVTGSLDPDVYGLTFPDNAMTPSIGFRSHIEIRNEWNGFSGMRIDYNIHPEKAIQVTCVHEFFHTIQYAMTRQIVESYIPEDFPVSWIEGTAVLMEDCGFNYVHDYLQYLSDYFNSPQVTVLEPTSDTDSQVYKNSIVAMYLFQFTTDSSCICFVKNMFFNDYQTPIDFLDNLRTSAGQNGRVWTDLLGSFHTASYYTGSRAVAGRFLKDASLISDQWTYDSDKLTSGVPLTKIVQPFAMNTFSFLRQSGNSDVLSVDFLGDSLKSGEKDTNSLWSVHCILKRDGNSADDSIFTIPIVSLCRGSAEIEGWNRFKEALIIVTNGRYDVARNATVTFESCTTAVAKGATAHFSAAPDSSADAQNAIVTVQAQRDLLCGMSIAQTQLGQKQLAAASVKLLSPVGTFYTLSIQSSWLSGATMSLAISQPFGSLHFASDTTLLSDSSLSVYQWIDATQQWVSVSTTTARNSHWTAIFSCPIQSSGTFGLFGTCVAVNKGESKNYFVSPNLSPADPNAVIAVRANADLPCGISFTRTTTNRQQSDSSAAMRLSLVGSPYAVSFPSAWLSNASLNLTITEPWDSLLSDSMPISSASISVYRWSDSAVRWVSIPTAATIPSTSTSEFQCNILSSGTYGLFGPLVSGNAIVAYPNPGRLKSNDSISFIGRDLIEIWIYTIDGNLLTHAAKGASADPAIHETPNGFSWLLRSNRGKPVAPGVYFASIGYKDQLTKGMKRKPQKIFILP